MGIAEGPFWDIDLCKVGNVPIQVEEGEIWYAKLPGSHVCSTLQVVSRTELTVLVDYPYDADKHPSRYVISDIKWVEKVS